MRKKRKIPVKTRPTIALVVDGECEMWYVQMLKRNLRSIALNIEPRIPQNKSIEEQFEIVKALATDNTRVFWIVDMDVILGETKKTKKGKKTALQHFEKCREELGTDHENVVVIVNNPCIEFWILLHFETTSKYFETCIAAEKRLRKYLKDYEKTEKYYTHHDTDIFSRLRPHLLKAIENALKTGPFDASEPHRGLTEMHKLFEIKELKDHIETKKSTEP
jgi:3-deoxy-D-arabino-heptulosonate 7-phosphate (DAHP) synthase class II